MEINCIQWFAIRQGGSVTEWYAPNAATTKQKEQSTKTASRPSFGTNIAFRHGLYILAAFAPNAPNTSEAATIISLNCPFSK